MATISYLQAIHDAMLEEMRRELEAQVELFESQGKMIEAHRIRQRTEYDMEMIREQFGFARWMMVGGWFSSLRPA